MDDSKYSRFLRIVHQSDFAPVKIYVNKYSKIEVLHLNGNFVYVENCLYWRGT